jgi:hypothetical protein
MDMLALPPQPEHRTGNHEQEGDKQNHIFKEDFSPQTHKMAQITIELYYRNRKTRQRNCKVCSPFPISPSVSDISVFK